MVNFTKEKIMLLHKLIAEETGGDPGVRDIDLLESAINNVYATFDGKELYATKEEKAAQLAYSLITNRAFVDGNKRIGVHAMLLFLEVNGIRVDATNEEVHDFGIKVASGKMPQKEIVEWIIKHEV